MRKLRPGERNACLESNSLSVAKSVLYNILTVSLPPPPLFPWSSVNLVILHSSLSLTLTLNPAAGPASST